MPRNPSDLLSLDRDPAVIRLLRACGTDDSLLASGSDGDRFLALAAALPLCTGYPLVGVLTERLQAATGLAVPLCPHTAPAFWQAFADRYWFEREVPPVTCPPLCPHCTPPAPIEWCFSDITVVPDPLAFSACDLPAWTARIAAFADTDRLLLHLPSDYAFVRPDPYHAAEAVRAVSIDGGTPEARSLLLSQAMRVLGETALSNGATLILRGGAPSAVVPLFAYLQGCGRLPDTVWIPEIPANAAALMGMYAQVRTGFVAVEGAAEAYAAAAPLGRAVVLRI